jgi:hypothetical protein
VQAGLYRHVSSEIAYQVTYQGERIGKVLVGVALLGADLPAVSNLADLGAYLSARGLTPRRVYRFARPQAGTGPSGEDMSSPSKLSAPGGSAPPGALLSTAPPDVMSPAAPSGTARPADATSDASSDAARVARLSAELAERRAEVERLRLRESEAHDALQLSQFRAERQRLQDDLDGWVRAGALPPALRDRALAAADAQEHSFARSEIDRPAHAQFVAAGSGALPEEAAGSGAELWFRGSLVRELLSAALAPQGRARFTQRETATAAPLGALARQAALPVAETLAREAGKLAATGRFTLAQAQAQVLAQDPELAARWLAEVNHTLPAGGA